jgi:hypothetical protein
MLIEREHNIAREDRDGSATEIEFMAFVSFIGGYFAGARTQKKTFSILANGGMS